MELFASYSEMIIITWVSIELCLVVWMAYKYRKMCKTLDAFGIEVNDNNQITIDENKVREISKKV
jgi:hypothetical protein